MPTSRLVFRPAMAGLLCAVLCAGALAQERPRIGLALSGGGARGFSHVGVLKALETLRVPVDCIVGTSAGSAVGAAYALGWSPNEIEARLQQADWDNDMFDDKPSRTELPLRRKMRAGTEPVGVTLGVGADGLRAGPGVLAGQKISLFLHQFLESSVDWASFDQLPIPFRAVTTDLVSGAMVVPQGGSLVDLVRASMAVPGAFAPVHRGQQRLVDGGLTQNLPVQAVRALCADTVIAVNVGNPLLGADDLDGLLSVALQVISIQMEQNINASLAALTPSDILITPALSDISSLDFGKGTQGIPAGETATLAAAPALKRLALDAADYAAWQARRTARRPTVPVVASLQIKPTQYVNPDYFSLGSGVANGPGAVDVPALHRKIRQWSGSGDFSLIGYSLRPAESGYQLLIDPKESRTGPNYLQIGFSGITDSLGNSDFMMQAALSQRWLNRWGAEWLSIARFGRERSFSTEWFQPLGANAMGYVQPRLSISHEPRRFFVDGHAVGEFSVGRNEFELGLGLQGHLGDLRLAWVTSDLSVKPNVGFTQIAPSDTRLDGWRVRGLYDQLDDPDFPRSGSALNIDGFIAGAVAAGGQRYQRWTLDAVSAHSWGNYTLRLSTHGAKVNPGSDSLADVVGAGGLFNLSGYQPSQFLGRQVWQGAASFYTRVLPLPQPLGSGLFAGVSLEAAQIRQPVGFSQDSLQRVGGALFLGASTALGPAFIAMGLAPGGERTLYLYLGRP